ncbi:MAG: thioredoxin domain-containing protein [Cyanobacteria bacterium P01_A01_bin.17]
MTNRLAESQSLYLRKHAENPIDWWPWCDEALATAQREDKPIFLSIGYSSCHWCTVMEGEAFSDDAIATYMNANFLPIKVDREERPDIDSIYMQAVQAMTGQGGWPLNMFLSPDDRVPFYGGTYFPVEPRYGRPGFIDVLQAIRNFYDADKEKLKSQKQTLYEHLRSMTVLAPSDSVDLALLQQGIDANTEVVARTTQGPSFPMIPYAAIALQGSRFESNAQALAACQQRGLDLALGGIYDHVGGGWHRYTVDPNWTVPHFEKMLYDNGQVMEYLANLWSAGVQEPAFERSIAKTVEWLQREMTAESGYFYAAQDADNFVQPTDLEPEEGRFYVWHPAELEELLTANELAALTATFEIQQTGNFEGRIVLKRQKPGPFPAEMEGILSKLFAGRYGHASVDRFPPAQNNDEAKTHDWPGRIPPVTDTKMIVAWNSLMISGLARAAAVFEQADYLDLAITAANFILQNQRGAEGLQRLNYAGESAVSAQSEDYAFLIKALLDLHQASLRLAAEAEPWLTAAQQLQTEFDERLWAIEGGGYYSAEAADDLLVRERSWLDNATPAANGVAIANLTRLALLTEDLAHLDRAEQALKTFSQIMQNSPTACPSLVSALDLYANHTLIRTTGTPLTALQTYLPTTVFKQVFDLPASAIGLACQGLTCQEPAETMTQLQEQITQSQQRSLRPQ